MFLWALWPSNPVYTGDSAMQELLTLDELKTNKAAQDMVRRLNEEMFPPVTSVADTTQHSCSPDSRTLQQRGQWS